MKLGMTGTFTDHYLSGAIRREVTGTVIGIHQDEFFNYFLIVFCPTTGRGHLVRLRSAPVKRKPKIHRIRDYAYSS